MACNKIDENRVRINIIIPTIFITQNLKDPALIKYSSLKLILFTQILLFLKMFIFGGKNYSNIIYSY